MAQAALEAARPDLAACFEPDTRTVTVYLRTSRRHPVRTTTRTDSPSVRECADLAVRRRQLPLLEHERVPFSRGQIVVRR